VYDRKKSKLISPLKRTLVGFLAVSKQIRDGSDILLYMRTGKTFLYRVRRGAVFHTHKGFLKMDRIIGHSFGSYLRSSTGYLFTALQPRPIDYALHLPRIGQIVYPPNMGLIAVYTGLRPGYVVVEGGTGSGALTIFLASLVQPDGKVYTYEVRPDVQAVAQRNVRRAGIPEETVVFKLADITKGIEERDVDLVVLDIPNPWDAIPHAYEALTPGGFFACVLPTINQVERCVEQLRNAGFVAVEAVECLVRTYDVKPGATRPRTRMIGHSAYLVFARKAGVGVVEAS